MKEEKVVYFQQYKYQKFIDELREYPDSFEYMIVNNYEHKFTFHRTECVQMDDCFAQLIEAGDHYKLVSMMFMKEDWSVQKILDFLSEHRIEIFHPISDSFVIQNASEIIDAKLFNGQPLVLCKKGKQSISLNPINLEEVTELYERYKKINNIGLAEKIGKAHLNTD